MDLQKRWTNFLIIAEAVVVVFLIAVGMFALYSYSTIEHDEEHDVVKKILKVPPTYKIPVFIGIGYADPNETVLEQNSADLDKQLHFGRWK